MKVWLFTLLISCLNFCAINGQNLEFSYPKGWYTSIGGGLSIPTFGEKGEGPLGQGYLTGAATTLPNIEFHFHPKWNFAFKLGNNSYRYDVGNFENYVNSDGYKVGDQNLNGAVRHYYLQTGFYYTFLQKGINHFEVGPLFGYGFISATDVSYLGLKDKEGVFVGSGPFYDVKKLEYGYSEYSKWKYHYGFALRFKQMYKTNDGFFIDVQFLRFETHRVYSTKNSFIQEGGVLLVSPTVGFVFTI
ncbi:MAG: hypothetical protein JXQ87_18285 [Bacteroidia bacterium]